MTHDSHNPCDIAVIGDYFMRSSMFVEALRAACGDAVLPRGLDVSWPDQPMQNDSLHPDTAGLKEYVGDPQAVIAHVGRATVFITHVAPLSASMLAALPSLELVVVSRGGPVNIAVAAAVARGIEVTNTPGRNASAVAEFTIGAILAETRNITRGHDALRRGDWRGDLYRADAAGRELSELTVGVIGYGAAGTRVVRLLRAFGCRRILVSDPFADLAPEDAAAGVEQVPFPRLLAQSDVITLQARVTEQTRGMFDAAAFAAMKPGAIFINTARGPLVDYDALYHALTAGHLRGATLDTFAVEPPPPESPLLHLPNVTLTPHIAGASIETTRVAAAAAAEEVRRHLAGEPPLNPCQG